MKTPSSAFALLLLASCPFAARAQLRPGVQLGPVRPATMQSNSAGFAGSAMMPAAPGPGFVVAQRGLPALSGPALAAAWQGRVLLLSAGAAPQQLQDSTWAPAQAPLDALAPASLLGASEQTLVSLDLGSAVILNGSAPARLSYAPEQGPGARPNAPVLVGLNRACVGDTLTASGVTSGPRCLEYASGAWRPLSPSSPAAGYPFAEYSATPVGPQRYLLAFGRGVGNRYAAATDALLFDVGAMTLTRQPLGGQAPSPRAGHVAVALNDEVLFFGGRDAQGRALGDAYSCNTQSWQCAQLAVPPSIAARFDAAATVAGSEVALFGGSNGAQPLGDLVLYAPSSRSFRALTLSAAIPPRASAALVAVRDGVAVLGGQGASGGWLSDAWWIKVR